MSAYLDRVRKENARRAKLLKKTREIKQICKNPWGKKDKGREFNRYWGIPEKYELRWRGLRGVAWYYFSRAIKQEEFKKHNGKCVSCPAILARWEDGQAAHYISVSRSLGMALLRKNIALSCPRCNNPTWSPDASIPFGIELDRRYGDGTAKVLYGFSQQFNDMPSERELLAMIKKYK